MTKRPIPVLRDGRWIDRTEVAKLIRYDLREAFPSARFSVRCQTYSGGGSINITWTDGPPESAIKPIVDKYGSRDFDGMIDLAFDWWHWLCPDGRVELGGTRGSAGSGGVRSAVEYPAPCEDAQRVHLHAGYVSLYREISDAHKAAVQAAWHALSDSERAALFDKLDLMRGLVPCQRPQSWRYDAELSDFNAYGAREDIFAKLARAL